MLVGGTALVVLLSGALRTWDWIWITAKEAISENAMPLGLLLRSMPGVCKCNYPLGCWPGTGYWNACKCNYPLGRRLALGTHSLAIWESLLLAMVVHLLTCILPFVLTLERTW